jgi:hypothetical protein
VKDAAVERTKTVAGPRRDQGGASSWWPVAVRCLTEREVTVAYGWRGVIVIS